MKVCVIQEPPVYLDLEKTMARALDLIARAAGDGANLIVFPEAWFPGYPTFVWRLAPGGFSPEPEDSPTMHFLHAVTGFADGVRVAVGGSLLGPPPHVGVALVYTPG